jgi:hypothetical protein
MSALNEISLDWVGEQKSIGYIQEVQFTYEDETYDVTISWNSEDGVDIVEGWGELPDELQEDFRELASRLETLIVEEEANA